MQELLFVPRKKFHGLKYLCITLHSLVVTDLRLETKGSQFEFSCWVCANVSFCSNCLGNAKMSVIRAEVVE